MTEATIYFNPRCGTCQKVLARLKDAGISPRVVEYLKHPPSETELDSILKKLNLPPESLAREKESVFKEKAEGKKLSRAAWLKLFHENPVLIQRPVVVIGNRAIIARPPERVEEILP
jgi:arsenate reductase (glutaredoxin)